MSYILAEFKGTYRSAHPHGLRDQTIVKDFHVKVKMKRESLLALGLNGLFATYYKEFLRKLYPDMIDTYLFDLVEATELDGTIIENPKVLSYARLIDYIATKKYPINPLLYSQNELRNEVVLYEQDAKGQQFLQAKLQETKGNLLATAAEIASIGDLMSIVDESRPVSPVVEEEVEEVAPPAAPVKEPVKRTTGKSSSLMEAL